MRSLTGIILSCLFATLTAAAEGQTGSTDQPQVVNLEPLHGPDISKLIDFGNCQWLRPLDEPNETLTSQPTYGSEKRVFYAARYGDSKDNIFTLVVDESRGAGTGFDTLYADLNNDNRLDPSGERFPLTLSGLTASEARNVRITLSVSLGGEVIPYSFDFAAFRYKDEKNPVEKVHATCRESTIFVGKAVFAGKECKIAIADLDSNGLLDPSSYYTSVNADWVKSVG